MRRIYRVEFRRALWYLELEAGRLWLLGPGLARRRLLREGVRAAFPVPTPLAVGAWIESGDGQLDWMADVAVPGPLVARGRGRLLGGRAATVFLAGNEDWVVCRPEHPLFQGRAPVADARLGAGWVEGPGRRLYALVEEGPTGRWWMAGWGEDTGFFRQPEPVSPPGLEAALYAGPWGLHLLWRTPEALYLERRSYAGWPRPRVLARGRFPPGEGEPFWRYGPEGLSAWLAGPGGPRPLLPPGGPAGGRAVGILVHDGRLGPLLLEPDPPFPPAVFREGEERVRRLEARVRSLEEALEKGLPGPVPVAAAPEGHDGPAFLAPSSREPAPSPRRVPRRRCRFW